MSKRKDTLSEWWVGASISGLYLLRKLNACCTAVYAWNKNACFEFSRGRYMPYYTVARIQT